MASHNYFVDPVSGSDTTGDGLSDATAWQSLQHAIDTISKGAFGDQINLKDSGANVLSADLSFTNYAPGTAIGGSGSGVDHLTIRGYSSTENDGGIGIIDGNAAARISSMTDVSFIDLEIRNTNPLQDGLAVVGNHARLINCYIHSIDRDAIGTASGRSQIISCRFENISRTACRAMTGFMYDCYFSNGANHAFTDVVKASAQGHIANCVFNLGGGSNGVVASSLAHTVQNCTFYGNGGFGTAYRVTGDDARGSGFIANIVSGFTTGTGVDNQSDYGLALRDNTIHDCGTDISDPSGSGVDGYADRTGNETLAESPLAESGSNSFANRATFFAPLNVGNVMSGNLPRGAVPSGATVSSGYSLHPLAYN